MNEFIRELNSITNKQYNEISAQEIPFKEFYEKLNEIEEIIKKYKLIPNIITPQIIGEKIPSLDFSDVNTDIENLVDDDPLDFQNISNNN
ncbi:hypothetical protein IKO18_06900 [bacterium]|nr:hypothetical protein [bacterium]